MTRLRRWKKRKFSLLLPALTRWAKPWRAYGAQERHQRLPLPEDIFRVKLDSMFLQQRNKLRIKIHFLVMLFLIPYVPNHDGNHRRAHTESSIALLPRELVTFLTGPS